MLLTIINAIVQTASKIVVTFYNILPSYLKAEELIEIGRNSIRSGEQWFDIPLEHIFGVDMKQQTKAMGAVKESFAGGYHTNHKGGLIKDGVVSLVEETKKTHHTGAYMANISVKGKVCSRPKTFFPDHWGPEKLVEKIKEACKNANNTIIFDKDGYGMIEGITNEGMYIKTVFSKDMKKILSVYPNGNKLFPQ